MLIGVTSFFRDEEAFKLLESTVLPRLFVRKDKREPIRMWVPGCATGEEAYSLAMVLTTFMDERKDRRKIQLFATDLDEEAIATARGGKYPASAVADVPDRYRNRFFRQQNGYYSISSNIREMVVFAPHDLTLQSPVFQTGHYQLPEPAYLSDT